MTQEDRIKWETSGAKEFDEFFRSVCALPHIQTLANTSHNLDQLSSDSQTVLKRFKTTLMKIFWMELGDCVKQLFVN